MNAAEKAVTLKKGSELAGLFALKQAGTTGQNLQVHSQKV